MACGTQVLATRTAHTNCSLEGRNESRLVPNAARALVSSGWNQGKGSSVNPARTPTTMISALTSRVRWCCDKSRKRRILSAIENIYKIVVRKLLKERDEIALAAIGVDVVFFEEHVTDLAHRPR